MEWSADQLMALKALRELCRRREQSIVVLSGPAGSGKTTLLQEVIAEVPPDKLVLTASTHKAAAVLRSDAITIHSALGLQPEIGPDGEEVYKPKRRPTVEVGQILVIDEASMVAPDLLELIVEFGDRFGLTIILCGDEYQLPPVNYDVAPAFELPNQLRLTTVHRQALDSPILALANRVRQVLDGGRFPPLVGYPPDVTLIDRKAFDRAVLAAFTSGAAKVDPDFARVLSWTNKTARHYNALIRRSLVGEDPIPYVGEVLVANTPVVHGGDVIIRNNETVTVAVSKNARRHGLDGWELEAELVEGGTVQVFQPADMSAARHCVDQLFKEAFALKSDRNKRKSVAAFRRAYGVKHELADLRPVHASTVHKSQGSTYRMAFIDLDDIGRCSLYRDLARLTYVALTRAACTVVMTGRLRISSDALLPALHVDAEVAGR